MSIAVDVRRKLLSVEASVQEKGKGPSEPEVAASEVGGLRLGRGARDPGRCGSGGCDQDRGNARLGPPGGEAPPRLGLQRMNRANLLWVRWMVEATFSAVKRKFGWGEAEGKERRGAPSGGYAALPGVRPDQVLCPGQGGAPM
ncbi:MAG TPA: hypothetical protein ENO38_02530 [Nitrososphaeria archaeon]|nr:hypothetical protein [Nitrososphaeria archaeon]